MDVNKVQKQLLNWASGASREDRYRFLKRFLDILPDEELAQVSNNASKAKKRRQRHQQTSGTKEQSRDKRESSESVPNEPETADESASEPNVDVTSKEPVPGLQTSACTIGKPETSLSLQSQLSKDEKWFEKFTNENIVGLDVEKVHCPVGTGKKQYEMKAGIVSIVNYLGQILYSSKVKHFPGSYHVWSNTIKKNGITEDSLKNGKSLEIIKSEIRKILNGKLVVLLEAEADFASLDLPLADFEYFDCTQFWYRGFVSKKGKYYTEKLGLRSLCHHYFGIDMQPNGEIHDASNDAAWTVKLFTHVYKTHPQNSYRVNPSASNEIPHFKPNSI